MYLLSGQNITCGYNSIDIVFNCNIGVNKGETWMIAAHQTITTVDGNETSTGTMLDIQFTDGLVSIIIVYDRQTQPQE